MVSIRKTTLLISAETVPISHTGSLFKPHTKSKKARVTQEGSLGLVFIWNENRKF